MKTNDRPRDSERQDADVGRLVSVVMITHNRRADVMCTIPKLLELAERPEIILVDNASTDDTISAVGAAFPQVRTVCLPRNMGAAGRNVGAQLARTPYVAFADDDSWWISGSLRRAVALFEAHAQIALVAATVLVGDEQDVDPTCELMANSPLCDDQNLPGRPVLGFIACGAVVRTDAFLDAGGFDVALGVGGEEDLLAINLAARGWSLRYIEDIVALHRPSATRSRSERQQTLVRNRLWTAWLRRRPASALRLTWQAVRAAPVDVAARRGLIAALGGAHSILARRVPVERQLEHRLDALERARADKPRIPQ